MRCSKILTDSILAISMACVGVIAAEPAIAQSLAPITNKVTNIMQQAVSVGQVGGGAAAAVAMGLWMANKMDVAWMLRIALGGAGLTGISTVAGWVNS